MARREMSTQRRSPSRPSRAATTAKTSARKASASRALPRLAGIRRELGGALGDERVAFADEGAVLDFAGEDDLAAAAEGVRDGAPIGDRQRRPAAFAVDDAEEQLVAAVANRAGNDLAGQVVARSRRGVDQLGGLRRCARGAERRVD